MFAKDVTPGKLVTVQAAFTSKTTQSGSDGTGREKTQLCRQEQKNGEGDYGRS